MWNDIKLVSNTILEMLADLYDWLSIHIFNVFSEVVFYLIWAVALILIFVIFVFLVNVETLLNLKSIIFSVF